MKESISDKAIRDKFAKNILNYLAEKYNLYHKSSWNAGWYNAKDKSFTLKIDMDDYSARIYIFRCQGFFEDKVFGQLMHEGHLKIDCGKNQMTLTSKKYYDLATEIGKKFDIAELVNHCVMEEKVR